MLRKIIKIDEEKCNGCGLCADACHEGAIGLLDGKARLMREDYCDGLGNCLPACPTGAIGFEVREAPPFDEAAAKRGGREAAAPLPCGCPGTQSKTIRRESACACAAESAADTGSRLSQWPVQLKLAPVNAPYLEGADLLIAADCTAYACGDFHSRFIKNRVTLIGCPKLDDIDYSEKLSAILKHNHIRSVTVARMEVPCCAGLLNAVKAALLKSGKHIDWQAATVATDGAILE